MKYTRKDLEIGDKFMYKDPNSHYPGHTIIDITNKYVITKKSDGTGTVSNYISDIISHINRLEIIFIKNNNYEIY